jgi:hypothetical protein
MSTVFTEAPARTRTRLADCLQLTRPRLCALALLTLFGLFLTPVFFYVVRRFTERRPDKPALAHGPDAAPAGVIPAGPA